MKKIAIIGCGNLGSAMLEGILKRNSFLSAEIMITRRNRNSFKKFLDQGIKCTTDNKEAVRRSEIVVLAVKPFQAIEVLNEIKGELSSDKILISTVTGVSINEIRSALMNEVKIFRAMPNTAVGIQQSMTCISFDNADSRDVETVKRFFAALGKVVVVHEKLMDASTVLAACGTAFAMRYIRASIQGGIQIGFDAETARLIAAQTVKGAAELLLNNDNHPEEEIDKVTTPKGCTIAGLNEMEHQGFSSAVIRGICGSYEKINLGGQGNFYSE